MKLARHSHSAVAFYNSLVIFLLLTIWIARRSGQLTTWLVSLLIIPVGVYFALAVTNHLVRFATTIKSPQLWLLHRLLSLYSLVFTVLFFLALVINISRPLELLFTLALVPLPAYLFLQHWRRSKRRLTKYYRLANLLTQSFRQQTKRPVRPALKKVEAPVETLTALPETEPATLPVTPPTEATVTGWRGIKDLDRRQFLKLIGGTSLGFAVLSLVMPQKAGAAFFGSVPGPGTVALKDSTGTKIDPAEKSPTDGYNISEIDDDALPSYYGFVNKDGYWYISKEDSTGSYRYVKGTTNFATNWTNRANLTYNYFDNVF